jgi:hypothetical protein
MLIDYLIEANIAGSVATHGVVRQSPAVRLGEKRRIGGPRPCGNRNAVAERVIGREGRCRRKGREERKTKSKYEVQHVNRPCPYPGAGGDLLGPRL